MQGKATQRSCTSSMAFTKMALICWLSKKQPTTKSPVFWSEFVTMTDRVQTLCGLYYKLRMMGVPISGPSLIYGDNMSVIHNIQCPALALKKKSNSIYYHTIRESVAMCELLNSHIPTRNNWADLPTKVRYGHTRIYLVIELMYDICD